MHNKMAKQVMRCRMAGVLALAMFINMILVKPIYAEIPLSPAVEDTETIENATETGEGEGESDGEPKLSGAYDDTWLGDWDYSVNDSDRKVFLQKYKAKTHKNITVSGSITLNGNPYEVKFNEDASEMFKNHMEINTLDLSEIDTENVTNMSGMFWGCRDMTTLNLTGFKTQNVTNMSYMFAGCSSLAYFTVTHFRTDKVTDMSYMFNTCRGITSLDLRGFDTSSVTDMHCMFAESRYLTSISMDTISTNNVTNMWGMFTNCTGLTRLDVTKFDTTKVTNMQRMFEGCQRLESIDVTRFKTNAVTDMSYMFFDCEALTSLDVSNFNTSNVTNMKHMFYYCKELKNLDLSKFSTGNVTDMYGMFMNCKKIENINLAGFNTSAVTDMQAMFSGCEKLESIDVSSFNTSKVTIMQGMFGSCYSLKNLDLSNFDMGKVTNAGNLLGWFYQSSLERIKTPKNLHVEVSLPGEFYDESVGYETTYNTLPKDQSSSKTYVRLIDITGISVSPNKLSLTIGETAALSANVLPKNAMKKDLTYTWSSDKPSIASVDSHGRVTGIAEGSATVKALASNGMVASCTVSVSSSSIPVERVVVTPANKTIGIRETFKLSAVVSPSNATDKSVTWTSNSPTIATVDASGSVTGVTEGSATITAKSANNKVSACEITVSGNPFIPVTGIVVKPKSKTIGVRETFDLDVTVYPTNATDKRLIYQSDKPSVASADSNGRVKGYSAGAAVITVKSLNGWMGMCIVTVNKTTIPAESISVTPSTKTIVEGDTLSLTAVVSPANTTNKSLTWVSNKPSVATVDNNGTVTGVSEGTAEITVKTVNNKTATCEVTVTRGNTTWQNDWNYTLDGTGAIILNKYTGTNEPNLVISRFVRINDTVYNKVKLSSNCQYMFENHDELETIDLSNVDTSDVTLMGGMFENCSNLTSINLAGLDTRKVTNMGGMFSGCKKLVDLEVSGLNTENVTWMGSMFYNCSSLNYLDLTSFNTSKVTNMEGMFYGCRALMILDVSHFDTGNVVNMANMFSFCENMPELDLSNFDMSKVTSNSLMLTGMSKLNTIETPRNVKISIALPNEFVERNAASVVKYTELPKNLDYSKTLISDTEVESISLNLTKKTISINEVFLLSANTAPVKAPVTWDSNIPAVATVDDYGNVKGVAKGTAIITARTSNGKTATCVVTVTDETVIPVKSISVTPKNKSIAINETFRITANVLPENATDKSVTWSSSKPSVASVDKEGKVTGLSEGKTIISAKAADKSAVCVVTVSDNKVNPRSESGLDPQIIKVVDVDDPKVTSYTAELVKGQKYTLGGGLWSTSNPQTVTVNKKSGVVTAKKTGIATIRNSATNSVYYMTVFEPMISAKTASVFVGSSVRVSIKNTGDMPVTWMSADIHKVYAIRDSKDDAKGIITGVSKGKTKVYAYVNGKAYPITVNVVDQAGTKKLSNYDSIRINAFQTYSLQYPRGVFKPSKVISWADTAGLLWRRDINGNWTDHTQAVTITKSGKVIGNTATDGKPIIARGTDVNGNSVTLEINVEAIPVRTDIYMNVGQAIVLKHSFVRSIQRLRWDYDNKYIGIADPGKVKVKIKGFAMGEETVLCRYQDVIYNTVVHVENPAVVTDSRMSRPKPSVYNYTLALRKGETYDIGMSGVYQDVLWKSNNNSRAFVDEYGRITARGVGKANLTTKVNGRKLKISVVVTE